MKISSFIFCLIALISGYKYLDIKNQREDAKEITPLLLESRKEILEFLSTGNEALLSSANSRIGTANKKISSKQLLNLSNSIFYEYYPAQCLDRSKDSCMSACRSDPGMMNCQRYDSVLGSGCTSEVKGLYGERLEYFCKKNICKYHIDTSCFEKKGKDHIEIKKTPNVILNLIKEIKFKSFLCTRSECQDEIDDILQKERLAEKQAKQAVEAKAKKAAEVKAKKAAEAEAKRLAKEKEVEDFRNSLIPKKKTFAEYPRRAEKQGIEGYAVTRFTISQSGKIKDISLVEENPVGFGFGRSAVKASKKLIYDPPVFREKNISTRMERRWDFTAE